MFNSQNIHLRGITKLISLKLYKLYMQKIISSFPIRIKIANFNFLNIFSF